jgi:TolB protein
MKPSARSLAALAAFALGAALSAAVAWAQDTGAAPPAPAPAASPAPAGSGDQPNEDILGTVEVNGSGGEGLPPLPKMGIVPIITTGSADSIVNLVVRRDLELSGQFDVLDENSAPPGSFTHASPVDLVAWRGYGVEYVVRVFSQPAANDSAKTELVGDAYLTPTAAETSAEKARQAGMDPAARDAAATPPDPRPAFHTVVPTSTIEVRAASHRLVDQLLGALTGRPGGFASEMTYVEKVGRWRRVFAIDSDGFDLRAIGPVDATALSPAFGPGRQIFYAISTDYTPFRLVFGPGATPVPMAIPGSILGLAFSADHARMGLTVMSEGRSQLWMGEAGRLQPVDTPPFANHPVFGPLNKIAYIAGSPVQRVYVDGKAISPPGFMASAPVFCETPQGLLVVYTVGVGNGADIIAMDTGGGAIRRLTQHEGANSYASCSPDGRLVAFFSTGKKNEGAGLFIMPILRPWLAKKISSDVGESLRWESL